MKKLAIGLLLVLFSLALAQSGPIFIKKNGEKGEAQKINFILKPDSPGPVIRAANPLFSVVEELTIEQTGTAPELVWQLKKDTPPPIVKNKLVAKSNCEKEKLLAEVAAVFPNVEIEQSLDESADGLALDESVPAEIRAGLAAMNAFYTLTFEGLDEAQTRILPKKLKEASACVIDADPIPQISVAAEIIFNDPLFTSEKLCGGRASNDHNLIKAGFTDVFAGFFKDFFSSQLKTNEVKVAVVDTGVDYNHPDLKGGVELGPDFIEGDNDPQDDHGHGTHVAGIIRATANNREGIVGSAPMTKLLAIRILSGKKGSTLEDGVMGVIKSIIWAANKGAKIINISSRGTGTFPPLGYAINYAVAKGSAVVVASGNEGIEVFNPYDSRGQVPANYHNVLTVGSINSQDQYSVFGSRSASNIGNAGFDNIKIVTYGGGLGDCASGPNAILSTKSAENIFNNYHLAYPDDRGGYLRMAGTSMATPLVAGAMALLLTAHPEWSGNQAQWAVIKTAVDIDQPGWDVKTGYGKLDIAKAFETFSENKPPPKIFIAMPVEGAPLPVDQLDNSQIEVTGTVDNGENTRWDLSFGQPNNWRKVAEGSKPVRNGSLAKLDIRGIKTGEVYFFKIVVYDEAGNKEFEYLSTVLFTAPADSPDSPQNLKAEIKDEAVQLLWQPPASGRGTVNYRVYRSTVTGGPYIALEDGLLDDSALNYADKNLEKNNIYYYVVSAIGQDGKESRFSNEVSSGVDLRVATVTLEEGGRWPVVLGVLIVLAVMLSFIVIHTKFRA